MAELCVEQGYRATTVDHVARRARVGRATIYAHFDNREQVFLAIVNRGIEELLERAELACPGESGGFEARIGASLDAVLAWVAEEPETAWACFVESLSATPESFRLYLDAITAFTTMLRDARPVGVLLSEATEESLMGGVVSIISGQIRAGQARQAPEMLPQLTMFLRGPYLSRLQHEPSE